MHGSTIAGVDLLEIPNAGPGDGGLQTANVVRLLRDDVERIVANWVIRVANMPAFRAWPELGLDRLKNAMPDLIDAMLISMRISDAEFDPEPIARAAEIAGIHGRERGRNGFPIAAMLAEFQALRDELCLALYRIFGNDPAWHDVGRELGRRLNDTVDASMINAAEAWVNETMNQTE